MYVCMYVCMHLCMYVCICVYMMYICNVHNVHRMYLIVMDDLTLIL